jgi:hypothetical protein
MAWVRNLDMLQEPSDIDIYRGTNSRSWEDTCMGFGVELMRARSTLNPHDTFRILTNALEDNKLVTDIKLPEVLTDSLARFTSPIPKAALDNEFIRGVIFVFDFFDKFATSKGKA